MLKRWAEHTAGRSGTSVASLERLFVIALTEVIGASMDNDGALQECQHSRIIYRYSWKVRSTYSDDTVGSNELNLLVLHGTLGVALAVRLDVSKVTYVSGLIGGSTVSLAMGVDC